MQKIAEALEVGLDALSGKETTTCPQPAPVYQQLAEPQATYSQEASQLNIVATFTVDNADISPSEAARLLESAACGTWVSCWTEDYISPNTSKPKAVAARALGSGQTEVDILFPHSMVEEGSITGILSVLGAAVTSTGAKMVDIRVPELFLRTFQGPSFGVQGLRDMTGKYGRPLLSTTLRPMHGLSPKMYGRAAYEALKGGVDITCDPTLLHSIPGNTWRDRFRYTAEAVHSASGESNEFKAHAANITAGTLEQMQERAEWAKELDLGLVMVDSAAIGWTALQSIAGWCHRQDMALCAMGGRALAGNMMSEQLEAKLLRLIGADVASIGSPLKGSTSQRRYSVGTVNVMRETTLPPSPENGILFDQPFAGMASCFPAVGGGHNPWHFPRLIDALGNDTIIQCGGSVMGHPWGSAAGATANRVAIESLVQARGEGQSLNVDGRHVLQRAMKYSPELKEALEFWQEGSFLFGVIPGDKHLPLEGTVQQPIEGGFTPLRPIQSETEDE